MYSLLGTAQRDYGELYRACGNTAKVTSRRHLVKIRPVGKLTVLLSSSNKRESYFVLINGK